ncbi:hypothetical protein D3C85_1841460 [compost metagenome]
MEQVPEDCRHFLKLAKDEGFSDDFGHIEMLVSKAAEREVWPLVAHWLKHQALPGTLRAAGALAL